MPGHNVHVRWSKILTGRARPDIDRFLDEFVKDIDENILKECVTYCRETIYGENEHISTILDFYEENMKISPTRYTVGFLLYSYLDIEDQIKLVKLRMRSHDSWRLFDPCIVLQYMSKIYGKDGIDITIVHMVLDEIARLCKISFTDARKGIETMVSILGGIVREQETEKLLANIRDRVREIIADVAFSIGINVRKQLNTRHILITKGEQSRAVRLLQNLEIYNIKKLDPELSEMLIQVIREFSKKYRVRVKARYNPITGLLETSEDNILIVETKDRDRRFIVFPHIVNVYSVGDIRVEIEDYIRDLAMMRPGSMKDDLKGGH